MRSRAPFPRDDPRYDRARYLPDQLATARLKVRLLEAEARRYGMLHLLEPQQDPRS